ncbi:Structural maintenance of chromosomes protein 5 [Orbilia oligospora]|uniref:Structural maintenance of chromosomes protein 5 n=1 Tax=Orbilia oligospora TaxID=2813651 RepID=A0A7C8VB09_ORBOL|nr:Structural maintenance of chromosomes protein 5 [Orbilia oligospora]
MPSVVSSQHSRQDNQDSDNSNTETPDTPSAPRVSLGRNSKLTIASKRPLAGEEQNGTIKEHTATTSRSKRRKLTPDSDTNDSPGDNNDEGSNPATPGEDGSARNEGGEEDDDDGDEYASRNKEVIIPVAEDYDSDDSEIGMADSLDKMRKNFEEIPHARGAIVRVYMENFVTYNKVTFEPGPSLNMVIGPNGTGKSTLVCAICLGLGFGPEHLGRAKDIAEFVKNGNDKAIIEIELKGSPTDEVNPTVRRMITRDGSTRYWIDGKEQPHRAVKQLMKLLNIQIDNLCQFLPQDRVVEFAALGPVPLLRATQRAAAPPEVLEDHDELKRLRASEVGLEIGLDHDRQSINTMEARQRNLERDVARLRERQTLQEHIKLLEKSIPFVEFQDIKKHRADVKQQYNACLAQLEGIRKEQEPQTKQIEQVENQLKGIKAWLEDEKRDLTSLENELRHDRERVSGLKEEEAKAEFDLDILINSEKERKAKIEKSKEQIARHERALADDPGKLDVSELNGKINEINGELRASRSELSAGRNSLEPLQTRREERRSEIGQIDQWILRMNNIAEQRMEALRKVSPESFTVFTWLQGNKNKFKGPVYGPPVVECTVKDPRYQAEIESLFSPGDKFAFTCTSRADFDVLIEAVYGDNRNNKGLGLSEVTIKYIEKGLEEFPRIASKDELSTWGFDGLALDFISGPSEVLSMLCNSIGLHRVGISKSKLSPSQQQSVKTGEKMMKWIAGGVSTSIRRRPDYPAAETEINSHIGQPKFFKTVEVERHLIEEKRQRQNQLEVEIEEIGREIDLRKASFQKLEERESSLHAEKNALNQQKDNMQKSVLKYQKIKTVLSNELQTLESLEKSGKGFKSKVARQETLALQINMDRVIAAAKFSERVREYVAQYRAVASAELHAIELSSNLQHYNSWNQSFKNRLESKKEECEELRKLDQEISSKSAELRAQCRTLIANFSAKEKEEISENHSRKTVDELKAEIQQEEVRLEGIHEGNPHAIRQYEAREKEINELRSLMDAKKANLDKHQLKIKRVRNRWEPRIDQLVENISEAFSRSFEFIGCAGSVRIRKEGKDGCDFENWAIEILVKFRESETMQVLTAQRQSGGERAVSTVFYLMALQSLARAPFRVVDEINQGMDPRNERLIHKRMVKIACKKHTSQYFLITPKLLVDLDYHERMKVHCINSGDWVADNHVQDFKKYIEAARQQAAGA